MRGRRVVILAGGLVAAAVAVVLWLDEPGAPVSGQQQSGKALDSEKQVKLQEKVAAVEAAKKSGDDSKIATAVKKLAEELGGRAGKMLNMATDRNLPVKMFGEVIDQNGKPVEGAKVWMVIAGGGAMAPGTGRTYFVTDANGIFEVSAKGQELGILDVEHPKLAEVYFLSETGSGRKNPSVHLKATSPYGKASSWLAYRSRDNPYVIRVWREEKFEKVVSSGGGYAPVPNGEVFKDGGMVTSCTRETKEAGKHWRNQKGSWSITFRPIDGGIQQTDDFYLNKAPETGYQSELTVSMQRDSKDYQVSIQEPIHYYYYYTEKGKRIYGSLEAIFDPYMYDDECRVDVKEKYNPNGSRNLAVRKPRGY